MFILTADLRGADFQQQGIQWAAYETYLDSLKGLIPPSAYAFATADWHYDPHHSQCPHDAWVESLRITEEGTGDRHEHRKLSIQVTLLGAYHDGYIDFRYEEVSQYQITSNAPHHGDWLYDEVRAGDHGQVIHEVELVRALWMIECRDISVNWRPV